MGAAPAEPYSVTHRHASLYAPAPCVLQREFRTLVERPHISRIPILLATANVSSSALTQTHPSNPRREVTQFASPNTCHSVLLALNSLTAGSVSRMFRLHVSPSHFFIVPLSFPKFSSTSDRGETEKRPNSSQLFFDVVDFGDCAAASSFADFCEL